MVYQVFRAVDEVAFQMKKTYLEFSFSSYHEKQAHFLSVTTDYLLYCHDFVCIIVCCHVYIKLNIQNLVGFRGFRIKWLFDGCHVTMIVGWGKVSLDGCVGYRRLKDALQVHFKYDSFRPGQLDTLLPVVRGRDVFVRIPTGGGKSLCIFLAHWRSVIVLFVLL